MAMYDWNGDGENNCTDDFIEFQYIKKCQEMFDEKNQIQPSNEHSYIVVTILAFVLGLFVTIGFAMLFGEADQVSGYVLFVVWMISSITIGWFVSKC